jgi:hypothetical protein
VPCAGLGGLRAITGRATCLDGAVSWGLEAPTPQWGSPPSLRFLGRPEVLSFEAVKDFERRRLSALQALGMEKAHYRVTDGAFMSVEIKGADGLFYIYGSNEVGPDDLPVAIEFRLPERNQ